MFSKLKKRLTALDPRKRSAVFRKSFKNASYSGFEYLVFPVLQLIATPIYIRYLGIGPFGTLMLINSIMGIGGTFNFGMGAATTMYVAKYRAARDEAGVVRVVRSTMTLYFGLSLLAGLLIYTSAPLLLSTVFTVGEENITEAILALRIGSFGLFFSFMYQVLSSIYQGFERYDLTARLTITKNVVKVGATIVVVMMGFGLNYVLLVSVVSIALGVLASAVIAKKMVLPGLVFLPLINKKAIKEVMSYGVFSWLQNLGNILVSQLDRFIIASLLGTEALGYYSACIQLAHQIQVLPAKAFSFLFPMASAAKEKGDTVQLKRIYFKVQNFITTMAISLGLPLFILANEVLTIWIDAEAAQQATLILRILVFSYAIMATSIVPYYYMNGTGFVRMNTMLGIMSGLLIAGTTVFMIPWLGIVGAAWARLAALPNAVFGRALVHARVIADRRWYAALTVLGPVFVAFGIATVLLYFLAIPSLTIVTLVFVGGGIGFVGVLTASALCNLFNPVRVLTRP